MKKLVLFALTLLSVNSAFAMSDNLKCISKEGPTVVSIFRFLNSSGQLYMTLYRLEPDSVPQQVALEEKNGWSSKTFSGTSSAGQKVELQIQRSSLSGVLTVDDNSIDVSCQEQDFIQF